MEKLPMCRICLAENVRMFVVVNKKLRELYETLTDNPFVTEDSRPMLACFFCCSKLKQCYQFQRKCLEAEELFAQMMSEGYEPNPLVNQDHPEFCNGFIQSPIVLVNIVSEFQTEGVAIKEELPTVCETLDYIIEPNKEYQSDELELENQQNSFSDVEDIPAQHSEADSEDDVPLIEIKTEKEEENEESRKKRRVSDTQRAPDAKIPKLHSQRTNTEDVITEAQKKNEQSDAVFQKTVNPQNSTFTTVMKFKEFNSGVETNIRTDSNNEDGNCKIASKTIDSDDTNRHPRLSVQEKPYKCDICQCIFYSRTVLIRHIRTHTGKDPYECGVCHCCFKSNYHLERHMRTHTVEKPYRCDVCQAYFSSNSTLTSHIRIHTDEKPYKCDKCQNSYKDKSCLKIHYRNHTGEEPYKCDICQHSFKRKACLIQHIRTHTGEKPYRCDVCQACFSHRHGLTRHSRTHTGVKPYKCNICNRSFSGKRILENHIIRNHTHKCNICHRDFKQMSDVSNHICTHKTKLTEPLPNTTPVTNSSLDINLQNDMSSKGNRDDINRHPRVCVQYKIFKCDICQRIFNYKYDLTRHTRLHTGEKPYKCEICPRSFIRKCHLIRHIRLHTGERPYKCDICQRSFNDKSVLKLHLRTHTGEKPFKCDICQRCFSKNSHLTGHIRTHQKPYKCDICHRSFDTKSCLTRHNVLKHS